MPDDKGPLPKYKLGLFGLKRYGHVANKRPLTPLGSRARA